MSAAPTPSRPARRPREPRAPSARDVVLSGCRGFTPRPSRGAALQVSEPRTHVDKNVIQSQRGTSSSLDYLQDSHSFLLPWLGTNTVNPCETHPGFSRGSFRLRLKSRPPAPAPGRGAVRGVSSAPAAGYSGCHLPAGVAGSRRWCAARAWSGRVSCHQRAGFAAWPGPGQPGCLQKSHVLCTRPNRTPSPLYTSQQDTESMSTSRLGFPPPPGVASLDPSSVLSGTYTTARYGRQSSGHRGKAQTVCSPRAQAWCPNVTP